MSTPADAMTTGTAGKKPGGKGGGFPSLKTREGKIIAGSGVVLLVVVLALRKGAGQPPADEGGTAMLQGGYDGTLQDRLDAIGFRGGTLEEWITATTGLAGSVDALRDLMEAQDKVNPPPPGGNPPAANLPKVGGFKASANTRDIHWRWAPVQGAKAYAIELIQGENTVIDRRLSPTPDYRAAQWGKLLQPGKPYRVRVAPIDTQDRLGPITSHVFRTD